MPAVGAFGKVLFVLTSQKSLGWNLWHFELQQGKAGCIGW
jgi:hypothetical protein